MESDETNNSECDLTYESDDGGIEDIIFETKYEAEYDEENLEFPIEILTADDVVKCMKETIDFVTSVVPIRTPTARALLNHFKWNKVSLMDRLFEGNQEKLFEEAKIDNPYLIAELIQEQRISVQEDCKICCLFFESSELISLDCDHRFCSVCWESYLHNQILDMGKADTITCPKYGCPVLVDETTCLAILKDSKPRQIYQRLITKSFIECNPVLKWCPNPGCTNAARAEYVSMQPVICQCKATFCFACEENWHSPLKCDLLKLWKKKCEVDTETETWLLLNTKECPKCKTAIEKNGGCNHISCNNRSCYFEFCWICMSPWNQHMICNRYEDNIGWRESEEESLMKRSFFYHDRYVSHQESLKLETNLTADVSSKVEELQKNELTGADVLLKAVDGLSRCRRTLMYTYAFAYYLQRNNETAIFEANQADLQRAIENLSKCLEHDIDYEGFSELKMKVIDLLRYCESRRVVLEKHVQEGYLNNSWSFIPDAQI